MNDPLSILGKSLAEEFIQKQNQWLPVDSIINANEDLGSFESSEEFNQVEKKWDDLESLSQSLETDFIPEDLTSGFFEKTVAEQDSENLYSERKTANLSSRFSSTKDSFNEIIFGATEIQKRDPSFLNDDELIETSKDALSFLENEIQSPNNKNRNAIDEISEEPNSIFKEENSFLRNENSISENEESPSLKNESAFLNENIFDENQNQKSFSKRNEEAKVPAKQKSEPQNTSYESEISKSIWSAPLRNLSDFAGNVSNAVLDKNDPSKPAKEILKPSSEEENRNSFSGKQTTPGLNNFQEGWYAIPDSTTPQDNLILPSSTLQQTPPLPVAMNGKQTEYSAFQNAQPQNAPAPDPDEILEALTERILRDFRRYYP